MREAVRPVSSLSGLEREGGDGVSEARGECRFSTGHWGCRAAAGRRAAGGRSRPGPGTAGSACPAGGRIRSPEIAGPAWSVRHSQTRERSPTSLTLLQFRRTSSITFV